MSVYNEKEIEQMNLSHEIKENILFIKLMLKSIYLGTCIILFFIPILIIF